MVEGALDAEMMAAVLDSLQGREVKLSLPRFESEFSVSLSGLLVEMVCRMPSMEGRRFLRMTGDKTLFISDVLHKSFIKVDESGTEAAAATVVVFAATGAPWPNRRLSNSGWTARSSTPLSTGGPARPSL